MKEPKRTELIGIRLTREEFERLKFAGKVSKKAPSRIAYELIQKGLEG